MSMISGQVDRLRTAAQTYRRLGNHSAESMLLDAADTIWQLRDDLQRANDAVRDAEHDESRAWDRVRKAEAENAKLREQIHWLKQGDILHVLTDQEYIDQCERERLMQVSIDALDKENAKLRELVSGVHMEYVGTLNECESLNEGLIYEYSGSVEADVAKSRAKFKADRHRFDAALRELGVEVDA